MPLPDKSHLATPSRKREDGWAPDSSPRFAPLLVDKWHREGQERDREWEEAAQARFRHSNAGACARAVAYAALGLPREPMDAAGHYITRQGSWLHEELQQAVNEVHPCAETEVQVSAAEGFAGHEDLNVTTDDGNTEDPDETVSSIEAKSVDGYAFKQAVGERYAPKGPKYDHVIQASLNARARDADEAVIVYLARGAISHQAAAARKIEDDYGRVIAEWTLPREQYEPIADKEIERVQAILALLDDGQLPKRRIPDPELPLRHVITKPQDGTWVEVDADGTPVDTGTTWHCIYCPYQKVCISTPAERCSTEVLS